MIVLAGAVLYFSNPSEALHLKTLNARATNESGEFLGAIRSMVQAVNPDVTYHNFYVFSLMTRRDKIMSFGALRVVIPTGE